MNAFCHYLSRLPTPGLRAQLALLCFQPDHSRGFPPAPMARLEALGLVDGSFGRWKPTWLGHGVNNWHRHLEASLYLDSEQPLTQPKQLENGRDLGPPCDCFRELFFRRGYCWCARPAGLHPGRLTEVAQRYLDRCNQQAGRDAALEASGSGQDLLELLAACSSIERVVLQEACHHPGLGVQLPELAGRTACLVEFPHLKAALESLLEKRLLQRRPEYMPTWDGRGLVRYMAELSQARALGLPLQGPFPGENGVDRTGRPCSQFRPLRTDFGYCWCGWLSAEHD